MRKLNKWAIAHPLKAISLFAAVYILSCLALSKALMAEEFDVKSFLNKAYVSVGVGYKFRESKLYHTDITGNIYRMNDPLSARIDIGYQYSKNLTFGVSHHSQWLTGFPFDNKQEYAKTEIFIDYKFNLGDLL